MHVSHVSTPNFSSARTRESYVPKRAERAREDVSAGQSTLPTPAPICECGHAERIHSVLEGSECRVCSACDEFTRALDPDTATEAARSHQEHREATYKALRRAVASWRLDEARRLLEDLIGAER